MAASVILAVSVVAAACGSSSKSSSGTTVAGSNTSVAGVGSTAPPSGEINVFLIPSPSSTAIQSFIPEFTKQTGIKVNFTETPYGEAHQKELLSYQQKKGAYDVAQFDNTFLAAFGAAKVMTPLDDYLAKSSAYDIADFSQGQQDYGKYGGSTLGLTLSTEPMIQWYRTDIYDALGLKPATTWDEFKSNAEKVKAAGKGDGALIDFGPAATWWWMTLVWSFGGKLYDDNLQPTVNTPEAVKATEYMKSLLPLAPEGALSVDGDGVTGKFISQDIGAMIQYSGYYGFMQDPKTNKYVGKIGTAKMPMGTADITHLAGWNIGIPADSKNKDAAWKFLEFVLGKANAINFLNAGAAAIGRESITSNADLVAKEPYLKLLNIPSTSRIERYPQLKVWPEMDKAIQDTITNIFTGKSDVKSGLDGLEKALGPILAGEKG
ncbi:MAG: sugar ABC transporter substrate-binding protein [Acidimicrobiales bacterium]